MNGIIILLAENYTIRVMHIREKSRKRQPTPIL